MAVKSSKPSERGEVIYEVVPVYQWLSERFLIYVRGVAGLFFCGQVKRECEEVFHRTLETYARELSGILTSERFRKSALGIRRMAYGKWVEGELYPALFNRLELLTQRSFWSEFDLRDRVRLTVSVIFETVVWCAAVRSAAWNETQVPKETAFVFTDCRGLSHVIDVTSIPSVRRYGPSFESRKNDEE